MNELINMLSQDPDTLNQDQRARANVLVPLMAVGLGLAICALRVLFYFLSGV